MKRQVSISIFCAILLIAMVWLYIKFYNETKLQEDGLSTEISLEQEEKAITISQDYVPYAFYLEDAFGRVVVYTYHDQKIYMETSIITETLPSEIQSELENKIYFETEAELYDFLESYSS